MAGNAIAGVGGAAAGAVVAGAVVAARYEVKEAIENSKQAKIREQMAVVNALFTEHLARVADPHIIEQARRTDLEMHTISPAFPHLKLAFDAVLNFQRCGGDSTMLESIGMCFGRGRKDEVDPKTVVCEILKAWMQAKCEDVDIHVSEVECYRNFARGFLLHASFTSGRFVQMICHVVRHFGSLGDCLLRQKQDCTRYIKALRKEAYNFVLHAVKLLLLGPTTFEVPKAMYSTDSLGWLRKTSMNRSMHGSDFDQELAEELKPQWATASGRILKALLCSKHGSSFCNLMEGARMERSSKLIHVNVQAAERLPLFTEIDIGGIDPFVKVSVVFSDAGIQKVFSEAQTKVIYNSTAPVWNETLEVSVLENSTCVLRVEILDWNTMSLGMVQSTAFAKTEDIPSSDAVEQAGVGMQKWLPLRTTGADSKPLGNARILMGFTHPTLEAEVQVAQQRWERGDFNAQRDGLVSDDFCMCFLHAVQETDSLVYFLDILFNECLEIAQSLGNLGMVLCARLMRPLLDEIEMRLLSVEKIIDNELLNLVYNDMVSKKLSERSWSRMFRSGNHEVNPAMVESCRKLQGIKVQMLEDLNELRHLCCDRYNSGHDVLTEAKGSIESLMGKIGGPDSVKRSGRFANASSAIPGLDKLMPMAETPALEDGQESSPKAVKKKKKKIGTPSTASGSTRLPSARTHKPFIPMSCFASEEGEGGLEEEEELRINPSDGQPMTFTDLRFMRVGASEEVLAEQWATMRRVPGSSCENSDADASNGGSSYCSSTASSSGSSSDGGEVVPSKDLREDSAPAEPEPGLTSSSDSSGRHGCFCRRARKKRGGAGLVAPERGFPIRRPAADRSRRRLLGSSG